MTIEASSTFAKVMQQLESPMERAVSEHDTSPKVTVSPLPDLMDPEGDVQEVLAASSEQFDRRLWEKLYNRATVTGCTHRQALTVTESILKRGSQGALEVLKSKTMMSKEVAAIRNSRPGDMKNNRFDRVGSNASLRSGESE